MENVAVLIDYGTGELLDAGIPDARREASSLLEIALGRDRTFLIAHPDHEPEPDEASVYREYVARRAGHEPFHYIKGSREFYGLEIAVSPAVLIPRPETEMLAERAINLLRTRPEPVFCEIGVGSGCISIAVLVNMPGARGVGLEISPQAIEVARRNSERLGTASRLDLRVSHLFEKLDEGEQFDIILSNPPYVPSSEIGGLQAEVREHEPHLALTDGGDGLAIIRRIVAGSPQFLRPGGALLFEFGMGQDERIRGMFGRDVWEDVRIERDLQGIPRTVEAIRR